MSHVHTSERVSTGWPVISAMRSKSLSTASTVSPAFSAVAAINRSGIEGARAVRGRRGASAPRRHDVPSPVSGARPASSRAVEVRTRPAPNAPDRAANPSSNRVMVESRTRPCSIRAFHSSISAACPICIRTYADLSMSQLVTATRHPRRQDRQDPRTSRPTVASPQGSRQRLGGPPHLLQVSCAEIRSGTARAPQTPHRCAPDRFVADPASPGSTPQINVAAWPCRQRFSNRQDQDRRPRQLSHRRAVSPDECFDGRDPAPSARDIEGHDFLAAAQVSELHVVAPFAHCLRNTCHEECSEAAPPLRRRCENSTDAGNHHGARSHRNLAARPTDVPDDSTD